MRLLSWILAAVIAAPLLLAAAPRQAYAGLIPLTCGDTTCTNTLKEWLTAEQTKWVPQLAKPADRLDVDNKNNSCPVARTDAKPVVHALVLAPFLDYAKLAGSQNDAGLLKSLFEARGVKPENLHVVDGDKVSRDDVLDMMRQIISCVRERDQVILTFSGASTSYQAVPFKSADAFLEKQCADPSKASLERDYVCDPRYRDQILAKLEELRSQFDEHVLFTSELVDGAPTGIRSKELSNFATQIRNRGGDAIFILDTGFAEGFRLLDQQQQAEFNGNWRWERGATDTLADPEADIAELFGSGEFAALYGSRSNEFGYETKKTGDVVLGELTFAVSEALRSNPSPTIEQLAHEADRTMAEQNPRQVPVFEATNPGLRFLATRDEPQANPERIKVINPQLTRGAVAVHTPEVEVVASYDGPVPAAFASIDGVNVEVDVNGQFRRNVRLDQRTEVPIRVYGRDASLLSERRLLFGADEVEASLAPVGRRLALVIGNQNYLDPAFPTLQTPIGDAKAVAQLLEQKFGFITKLKLPSGAERSLLLLDATKADIQKALFDLRKSLTAEDQLVVYYAGHGQTDSENTAYWVPVDGDASEDFTWIRAFEITEDLRKLASGSVLLISDSCYAGGLSRDAAPPAPEGPRDRYLAKSTRFKARQLIASGGDEPVQDGGGGDHSLFARALLEGFDEMPDKIFTANELFDNKVKPKSVEYAFATSAKGQTPVFYRMTNAGDEPESEFVFVRK